MTSASHGSAIRANWSPSAETASPTHRSRKSRTANGLREVGWLQVVPLQSSPRSRQIAAARRPAADPRCGAAERSSTPGRKSASRSGAKAASRRWRAWRSALGSAGAKLGEAVIEVEHRGDHFGCSFGVVRGGARAGWHTDFRNVNTNFEKVRTSWKARHVRLKEPGPREDAAGLPPVSRSGGAGRVGPELLEGRRPDVVDRLAAAAVAGRRARTSSTGRATRRTTARS